ncbi:MAG: hypothetical protein ACJAVR_002449 [Paracoccaceae bacterium]|jgi:hypothetical protein
MLRSGENGGVEALPKSVGGAHERLALTRILLWAEQEAESLGAGDAASRIREAITALHRS